MDCGEIVGIVGSGGECLEEVGHWGVPWKDLLSPPLPFLSSTFFLFLFLFLSLSLLLSLSLPSSFSPAPREGPTTCFPP